MKRSLFVIVMVLILLFTASSPAKAISYGEPDGSAHPNVGSIVVERDGEYFQGVPGRSSVQPCSDRISLHSPLDGVVQESTGARLRHLDLTISSSGTF
jgi:hypothetical protein